MLLLYCYNIRGMMQDGAVQLVAHLRLNIQYPAPVLGKAPDVAASFFLDFDRQLSRTCPNIGARRDMEIIRPKRHRQPGVSNAQPEQPVGVTVLTEKSFGGTAQIWEPRHFNKTDLGELTPHVEAYRSRWPDDLVIIIVDVTGKLPVGLDAELIKLTDRRFPAHIIGSVLNEQTRQPYVPGEGNRVPGNAAWVLKYRGGSGVFHDNPVRDSKKAFGLLTETTWIAAWVGRQVVAHAETPRGKPVLSPMAVIIFSRRQRRTSSDCNYYGKLLANQYERTRYRWKFVRDQPLFLFMDLDRLFNNFKVNVATTKWEINTHMVSSDD